MKTNPISSIFNIMGIVYMRTKQPLVNSMGVLLFTKWSRKHCRFILGEVGHRLDDSGMTNWWRRTDAGDADFAKRRRCPMGRTVGHDVDGDFPAMVRGIPLTVISSNGNHKTGPGNPQEKDALPKLPTFFWTQPWYDCLLFTQDVPVISEFCCHPQEWHSCPWDSSQGASEGS